MTAHSSTPAGRQAVVVLGMHRSGTSALAGVLARLGCALPEQVMPANDFNPKGFYESIGAYNLNDALLRLEGSSWADWRPLALDWLETEVGRRELARGAQMLEEEFAAEPLFVLKDPRICRLLPYWTRLFEQSGIAPVYVHTHRSPVEVARSLERREGWPLEAGLLLWLRHELEAEAGTRGAARAFTSYDQLLSDWRAMVAEVQARSGLVLPEDPAAQAEEIEAFLSADLRHSTEGLEGVAPVIAQWIGGCLEVLERWAAAGEQAEDYALLDAIRAEFDAVMPLFGPVTRGLEAQLAEAREALACAERDAKAERNHAAKAYQALQDQTDAERSEAARAYQALEGQLEAERVAAQHQLAAAQAETRSRLRLLQIDLTATHEAELSAALASQRRQAERRLEAQREALAAMRAERDQARMLVEHREQDIARLRTDLEHQIADREALAQRELALRQSTSWKMTAPVRWLVRGLRGQKA